MDAQPLLSRLVRSARGGPEAVLATLASDLARLGFAARPTRGQPGALLWTRGSPTLIFSGHVDVVPAAEGWTRDPFGGEVEEGRLWGRGACDMLGGVAAFVAAAARRPRAPCGILLTTDEETGMHAAQNALSEGLLSDARGIVVGEPTSFDVGVAEKGVLWLRVVARGRTAHGSMPHLGDNAAQRLVRVLHAMGDAGLPGAHPLLGSQTRTLARIRAGEAVNQVPALAWAELDVRYLPGQDLEEVMGLVQGAAERVGERVDVEVLSHHVPFESDPGSPLVQLALASVEAVKGRARPVGLPYGTEASQFAPHGIPTLILGPGEPGLAHTAQENIRLADLEDGVDVYARLLDGWPTP